MALAIIFILCFVKASQNGMVTASQNSMVCLVFCQSKSKQHGLFGVLSKQVKTAWFVWCFVKASQNGMVCFVFCQSKSKRHGLFGVLSKQVKTAWFVLCFVKASQNTRPKSPFGYEDDFPPRQISQNQGHQSLPPLPQPPDKPANNA